MLFINKNLVLCSLIPLSYRHAQVSVGRFGMATVTGGQGGAGGDTNTVG